MNQRCLRAAVEETLTQEGIRPRAVEVSIALVDDATMQGLNAQYRGKDTPTDVLSFGQTSTVPIPGTPRMLGDVVISVETALTQATAGGRTLDEELAQLVIHGVLHLLGYDDVTPEGYEEMVRTGTAIAQRVQSAGACAPRASSPRKRPDAE